jgi:hypothetical protein
MLDKTMTTSPDADEFDWLPENRDAVVARTSPLALYINTWGQIVLRKFDEKQDVLIEIDIQDVPRLIWHLKEPSKVAQDYERN